MFLYDVMEEFAKRANDHPRVSRLLKSWDRDIVIQTFDLSQGVSLIVRGQRVTEVVPEVRETSGLRILVQGDLETLRRVFLGEANPAELVLDGSLVVYGSDVDQVKLDAITLVLWGSKPS